MKPHISATVLFACALLFGPTVAAQWGWLRGSAITEFSDSDWAVFRQTARGALEDTADGVIVDWENPETRTRGSIRPLATFMFDGRPCRTTAFRTTTGRGTFGQAVYTVCLSPDGEWHLAPDGTQTPPGEADPQRPDSNSPSSDAP